jgi:16S rRNA (adenine1518-N6/adenine1519-N6)-dimethyltransferase
MSKQQKPAEHSVRSQLYNYGIHAKKRIGQHFLTDGRILDIIINAAELKKADIVVEVGSGLGILTETIAAGVARLYAIEIDKVLAAKLKQKLPNRQNIEIINADILKLNLPDIIGSKTEYKVVANLPYYITSPILNYFVHGNFNPASMVVMLQKEVADSIIAGDGNLSVLSISMRIYTVPRLVSYVSPESFFPVPKVHSAILYFQFLKKPAIEVDDIDRFLNFVGCGFATPRKYISNSLAIGLNIETGDAVTLLERAGIEASKRPEKLSLSQWQMLYEVALKAGYAKID